MRRKIAAGIAAAALALTATACTSANNPSGQAQEQQASNSIEKTFVQNQPVPIFNHSDIRATAIAIEAIQALGENTTSFALSNDGKLLWSCPSLGEPVHATDQITNPFMPENTGDNQGRYNTIPVGNMDPNGIYSGNSSGTYVLCVGPNGVPYAHYAEEYVDVVSGPAVWNPNAANHIVLSGAPVMPSCSVKMIGGRNQTVCVK